MKLRSLLFCLPLIPAPILAQGPLDPPVGAPAPSMKSAQEIFDLVEAAKSAALAAADSRTPISALPMTIDQSGSYYLTQNLTTSGSGIMIEASNVTIDFNGCTITGSASTATDIGVEATGTPGSPLSNITLKNGNISGFYNSVSLTSANYCSIHQMRLDEAASRGLDVDSCPLLRVEDTTITRCSTGITFIGGGVNASRGAIITRSQIDSTFSDGIYIGAAASAATVSFCTLTEIGGNAIYLVSGASGCRAEHNTIRNAEIGILTAGGGNQDNRFDSNHVSTDILGAVFGIRVDAGPSLLIRNTVGADFTTPYFATSQTLGPIVSANGSLSSTGDESHPFANFVIDSFNP